MTFSSLPLEHFMGVFITFPAKIFLPQCCSGVGGQQKWEDVAGGGGDNRGHIGGEGGPDGDGVDITENTEVGAEGEGERISSEDSRGNGDGEGDMLEREVEVCLFLTVSRHFPLALLFRC
jgi:hypothetical protein